MKSDRDGNLWLAHDDDNKVDVLYATKYDTEKQEVRELTKLLRRGLTIRRITDADGARAAWGKALSEKALRAIAAAPEYDPDEASATQIAKALVGVE